MGGGKVGRWEEVKMELEKGKWGNGKMGKREKGKIEKREKGMAGAHTHMHSCTCTCIPHLHMRHAPAPAQAPTHAAIMPAPAIHGRCWLSLFMTGFVKEQPQGAGNPRGQATPGGRGALPHLHIHQHTHPHLHMHSHMDPHPHWLREE